MLTKAQLKKFFTCEGKWLKLRTGDPSGSRYLIREDYECWCNDKYHVSLVLVYEDGRQVIFDDRPVEVSKGAEFTFYKITRRKVAG